MIIKPADRKIWVCVCGQEYHSTIAIDECYKRDHGPIVKLLPVIKYKIKRRPKPRSPKPTSIEDYNKMIFRPKCLMCKGNIKSKTAFGRPSRYCDSCKAERLQKIADRRIAYLAKLEETKIRQQKARDEKLFGRIKLKGECKNCTGLASKHSRYCYPCRAKRVERYNMIRKHRREMKEKLGRLADISS